MSVLNSSKSIHKDGKYKNVQECPNGEVSEDTFKEIFEKFFPYGSEFTLFREKVLLGLLLLVKAITQSFEYIIA